MNEVQQVDLPDGKRGPWRIERFTVSREDAAFENLRSIGRSNRFVSPGTYTRLMRGRCVVMSDTPDERRDHISAVRKARGHCLINGLGLGMVLKSILLKDVVESVIVVEEDVDVISLVGPQYANDPRVRIIQADALEYKAPKGMRFGMVWHDIWDFVSADNLRQMHVLHRKYGRQADWQGSWCRAQCELEAERYA